MKNHKLIKELIDIIKDVCILEDIEIEETDYDKPLIGEHSKFDIDSLDLLEIGSELQRQYSVRIDDKNKAKVIFKSLYTLSDFICNNSPKFIKSE